MVVLPVEPDLVSPWNRNVWLFGLRTPFSLVFIGLMTMISALAPQFHWDRYLAAVATTFFGLVLGAHYIDIASSRGKYLPYFPTMPVKRVFLVGFSAVIVGLAIGVFMAYTWSLTILVFVVAEGLMAVLYPMERPKILHTYAGFLVGWGFIPSLAAYYLQTLTVDLTAIGLALFVGFSVAQMHHMAVIVKDEKTVRDSRLLLKLYMASVYSGSLVLLASKLI